jgi:hypothetical protein
MAMALVSLPLTPVPGLTLSVPFSTVSMVVNSVLSTVRDRHASDCGRGVFVNVLGGRCGVDRRVLDHSDRDDRRLQVADCVAVGERP